MQEIQRKESQSSIGIPNLFVYGNDVDSVDVAVRVAMVRILLHNTSSTFQILGSLKVGIDM